MTTRVRLLLVAVLATAVAAADDAEFAFNLLSDVAPVLALFGEEFAKQFMSESLTWTDHLIFAMVPLGILTTITSAIRVYGPQVARSFIGRARENRALTEIELMSSTSGEVCELFNGNSIVRAMGKPRIAQFLIFPKKYDEFEKVYESEISNENNEPEDQSCGIHSLDSAREKGLIECNDYQSRSTAWVQQRLWHPFTSILDRNRRPHDEENEPGSSKSAKSRDCDETASRRNNAGLPPPGPPNLQLNLSSDYCDQGWLKKGHEITLVAIAAVLVQGSLIAIAAFTALYLNPKSLSLLDSKVYGFPCYVVGSFLLSLGTGLCSIIVEHSTIEHSWEPLSNDREEEGISPRLVWLQQSQTVNDQSFNGYIILAGSKRRIITSRRNPTPIERRRTDTDTSSQSPQDSPVSTDSHESAGEEITKFWEWLTVGAALSAGIGFTAQFMGLRGLAFPCSIAHLLAVFIMALLRASVRRRLGRIPEHCLARSGYELDLLAARIAFEPDFREFLWYKKEIDQHSDRHRQPRDVKLLSWRIQAPDRMPDTHFVFRSSERVVESPPSDPSSDTNPGEQTDPNELSSTPALRRQSVLESEKIVSAPDFRSTSSKQLLRVRERLGNLCTWKSKSSESALSLAQSVELFMNTFLRPDRKTSGQEAKFKRKEQRKFPTWSIEAAKLTSAATSEEADWIEIPIREKPNGMWEVGIGTIDAALSLWTANIETRRLRDLENPKASESGRQGSKNHGSAQNVRKTHPQSSPDWRRTKAGDDLMYSFGRIIGDNLEDGVLKRDISWWVDSLIAEQSPTVSVRGEDVELIIGANGNRPSDGTAHELGVISKACLPTILAQHLFTSFMWAVVECLPKDFLDPGSDKIEEKVEIDGHLTFDTNDFAQAWLRPRIRHRELTEVVRKMESYGLGSTTDILLCMIPALSFMSLLPNQAILKLMPHVGSDQGWVETTTCYKKLLETIQGNKLDEQDKFTVSITAATMDFLSFAYEPYDADVQAPPELEKELRDIVKMLVLPKFNTIMEKLAPVYASQRRLTTFESIFRQFSDSKWIDKWVNTPGELDESFAKNTLDFSQDHVLVFSAKKSDDIGNRKRQTSSREDGAETRDIFGWTPYHYGYLNNNPPEKVSVRFPKLLDNFGQSPLHVVALAGMHRMLKQMLSEIRVEDRKAVTHASGLHGMTLLHLISKSGELACLDLMPKDAKVIEPLLAKRDVWGRQALHIASKFGHDSITIKLLEMKSQPDQIDEFGKSPVDYFLDKKKGHDRAEQARNRDRAEASDTHRNNATPEPKHLSKEACEMFLKFAKEPGCRYSKGRFFLHIAVEVADEESIDILLHNKSHDIEARDDDKRTPLHYAIRAGRNDIAKALIYRFKANRSAEDARNKTPLMFAAEANLIEVATALLDSSLKTPQCDINKTDADDKTALHYAGNPAIADFLVTKNCNLLAKDSDGRTALHTAIEDGIEDVALYLLKCRREPVEDPFDNSKDSLLITACKRGVSAVIGKILEQWPDIINKEDATYGQPPLSWACEFGYDDIVEQLLDHEYINVNQPATRYMQYSPLHFAAAARTSRSLDLLLRQSSLKMNQVTEGGETALQQALRYDRADAARSLLLHIQTPPGEKFRYAKEFTFSPLSDFQRIVSELLGKIVDTSLVLDYLLWLGANMATSNVSMFVEPFVAKLKQGEWKQLRAPWHVAILLAKLGYVDLAKTLKQEKAKQQGCDEDNWTSADYVERFDDEYKTLTSLVGNLQELDVNKAHERKEPTALAWDPCEKIVQVDPCKAEKHGKCSKVHYVEVIKASQKATRVCIRSDHSISPLKKHFYFEVQVLQESKDRILGIGFCGLSDSHDQMPGWFSGSWGYHGDDGELFIESGSGYAPSSGFGKAGVFGHDDVVGVCLNVETGEGFCTRNGVRLDMGDAFEGYLPQFKLGKLYPCVGFDVGEDGVGLQFVVNMDGSDSHPFKYRGGFHSPDLSA